MKRLLLLLVMLCYITWATPVEAAVNWQSYSDTARTVMSDNFTASGAIVYLKASGLAKNKTYRATFYDALNNNVLTHDAQSDNNGVVLSQVKPSDYPASSPGTWKAELYKVQPLTLESTDNFTVQGSAIPEFPTVFTAVWIVFICILIWWSMRGRVK